MATRKPAAAPRRRATKKQDVDLAAEIANSPLAPGSLAPKAAATTAPPVYVERKLGNGVVIYDSTKEALAEAGLSPQPSPLDALGTPAQQTHAAPAAKPTLNLDGLLGMGAAAASEPALDAEPNPLCGACGEAPEITGTGHCPSCTEIAAGGPGVLPMEALAAESPTAEEAAVRLPHVTRVRSNIKGGVDVALAPLTAVVGANRSGKTQVIDALRWALTGKHPVGPHGVDLLRLAPKDADEVNALAVLADGTSGVKMSVDRKGKGGSKPERHTQGAFAGLTAADLEHIVPLDALGDLLDGRDSKTTRNAIFARFAGAVSITAPEHLDTEDKKLWAEAVRNAGIQKAGIADADKLVMLIDELGKMQRATNASAKSEAEVAAKINEELATIELPTDAAIEAAKQALLQAQQAGQIEALLIRKKAIDAEVEQFKAHAAQLPEVPPEVVVSEAPADAEQRAKIEADIAKLQQELADIETSAATDDALALAFERIAEIARTSGSCPCCNGADGMTAVAQSAAAGTAMRQRAGKRREGRDDLQGRLDIAQRALQTRASVAQQDRTQRQQVRAAALRAHDEAMKWRDRLLAQRAENNAALEALSVDPANPPLVPSVEEANANLVSLQTLKSKADTSTRAKVEASKLKKRASILGMLKDEASKMQHQLLKTVKANAEQTINSYMPVGLQAVLTLTDGGKDVCRFEVQGTDGEPHGAFVACGIEWNSLVVALACAWTEGAPLRVLLLDDAVIGHFDRENLHKLLYAIRNAVKAGWLSQAVIVWNRPEELAGLEDWHVVVTS